MIQSSVTATWSSARAAAGMAAIRMPATIAAAWCHLVRVILCSPCALARRREIVVEIDVGQAGRLLALEIAGVVERLGGVDAEPAPMDLVRIARKRRHARDREGA